MGGQGQSGASPGLAWGFPWLDDRSASKVKEANLFVVNSINLARAVADAGGHYLFEHPEDLGRVADESPASIWQLDEMRQLQVDTRAGQFFNVLSMLILRNPHDFCRI